MIPASYLFKDAYRRHWEEADPVPAADHRRRFLDGLMTPIAGAIIAVFHRRPSRVSHLMTGPVYE